MGESGENKSPSSVLLMAAVRDIERKAQQYADKLISEAQKKYEDELKTTRQKMEIAMENEKTANTQAVETRLDAEQVLKEADQAIAEAQATKEELMLAQAKAEQVQKLMDHLTERISEVPNNIQGVLERAQSMQQKHLEEHDGRTNEELERFITKMTSWREGFEKQISSSMEQQCENIRLLAQSIKTDVERNLSIQQENIIKVSEMISNMIVASGENKAIILQHLAKITENIKSQSEKTSEQMRALQKRIESMPMEKLNQQCNKIFKYVEGLQGGKIPNG